MNLVKMAYAGHYPRKRFRSHVKQNKSHKTWGDGYWDGIGYWKTYQRAGDGVRYITKDL